MLKEKGSWSHERRMMPESARIFNIRTPQRIKRDSKIRVI